MKCNAGVSPAHITFPMQARCNAGVPPALITFSMQARWLRYNGIHRLFVPRRDNQGLAEIRSGRYPGGEHIVDSLRALV